MKQFKQVLFPVDFSSHCESTVPYVKEVVRSYNARLTLLHVAEIPTYSYGTMPSDTAIAWDAFADIYKTGQTNLAAFKNKYFNDLNKPDSVQTVCDQGDPGYAILAQAEKIEADLIMMPTHGHGPFRTFLLGSNTARVLHRASCAVWTGAHLELESGDHVHIKNILCALDLERESGHVIDAAVTLASKFSAQVCLIHCVPIPECTSTKDVSPFDHFLLDYARDKIMKMQKKAGTQFEILLEGGSISKVVRTAALGQKADVVVIGRGHVQSLLSRLRSNAYGIIRDAPCPVLSIEPKNRTRAEPLLKQCPRRAKIC